MTSIAEWPFLKPISVPFTNTVLSCYNPVLLLIIRECTLYALEAILVSPSNKISLCCVTGAAQGQLGGVTAVIHRIWLKIPNVICSASCHIRCVFVASIISVAIPPYLIHKMNTTFGGIKQIFMLLKFVISGWAGQLSVNNKILLFCLQRALSHLLISF